MTIAPQNLPCPTCGRKGTIQFTGGTYATEPESMAAFDKLIEASGLFRSYAEVGGYYLQPRLGAHEKQP